MVKSDKILVKWQVFYAFLIIYKKLVFYYLMVMNYAQNGLQRQSSVRQSLSNDYSYIQGADNYLLQDEMQHECYKLLA